MCASSLRYIHVHVCTCVHVHVTCSAITIASLGKDYVSGGSSHGKRHGKG